MTTTPLLRLLAAECCKENRTRLMGELNFARGILAAMEAIKDASRQTPTKEPNT